jgi:hypothetical protein
VIKIHPVFVYAAACAVVATSVLPSHGGPLCGRGEMCGQPPDPVSDEPAPERAPAPLKDLAVAGSSIASVTGSSIIHRTSGYRLG